VRLRKFATTAIVGLVIAPLAACSSSGSNSASSSASAGTTAAASTAATGAASGPANSTGVTLSYWASNQGTSLANDQQVLTPELNKFTAQTGIKVNL
jgi:multiple sugar transport system substrate-binding protein